MLSIVRNHLSAAISVQRKKRRVSVPEQISTTTETNEIYEERILTHRFPSEHDILDDVKVNLQMLNG